ncbi:MAG: ACT domain-containing protein [Desulfurococcales archaeon]|nr:ACT domain-containing protein [Desulfurococcales archaeon]
MPRKKTSEDEEKITVADAVRIAVTNRASYLECLRDGVVNYTWLAEKIMNDVERITKKKKVNIDAVKAALIRFQQDLQQEETTQRTTVGYVISKSTTELQNDITVITMKKEVVERRFEQLFKLAGETRFFNLNQGKKVYTIVISSEDVPELLRVFDKKEVLDKLDNQSAIIIISPYEIVNTPGVVSFITRLLYVNGVNITQLNSSYTDTILILPKEQALKAYHILEETIEEFRSMIKTPITT